MTKGNQLAVSITVKRRRGVSGKNGVGWRAGLFHEYSDGKLSPLRSSAHHCVEAFLNSIGRYVTYARITMYLLSLCFSQ